MARRHLVVQLMAVLTARAWTAYLAFAGVAVTLYLFGPVMQGADRSST